jgi:hypothetical protein
MSSLNPNNAVNSAFSVAYSSNVYTFTYSSGDLSPFSFSSRGMIVERVASSGLAASLVRVGLPGSLHTVNYSSCTNLTTASYASWAAALVALNTGVTVSTLSPTSGSDISVAANLLPTGSFTLGDNTYRWASVWASTIYSSVLSSTTSAQVHIDSDNNDLTATFAIIADSSRSIFGVSQNGGLALGNSISSFAISSVPAGAIQVDSSEMTLATMGGSYDIILSPGSGVTKFNSSGHAYITAASTETKFSASGHITMELDADNNDTASYFRVTKNGSASTTSNTSFQVDQFGTVRYGNGFTAVAASSGNAGRLYCHNATMAMYTDASNSIEFNPGNNKVMPGSTSVQLGDATTPFATLYANGLALGGSVSFTTDATYNIGSKVTGTSFNGVNTYYGATLNLGASISNKKFVMWEALAKSNDYEFYGIGISTQTMRYHVDATTADHVFFAATSSTTATELLRVKGNGGHLYPGATGTSDIGTSSLAMRAIYTQNLGSSSYEVGSVYCNNISARNSINVILDNANDDDTSVFTVYNTSTAFTTASGNAGAGARFRVQPYGGLTYGSSNVTWPSTIAAASYPGVIECATDHMTLQTTTASKDIILAPSSNAVIPYAHNTVDLGTSAARWKGGYFQGTIVVSGGITSGSTVVTTTCRAFTDNTYDCGTTAVRWRNIYVADTIGSASFPAGGIYLASTGGTPSSFNHYEANVSQLCTLGGAYTGVLTVNLYITRQGNQVTIRFPGLNFTATSAVTSLELTSIPTRFRPSASTYLQMTTASNAGTSGLCAPSIDNSTGVMYIAFYSAGAPGTWSTAAPSSINPTHWTYTVD